MTNQWRLQRNTLNYKFSHSKSWQKYYLSIAIHTYIWPYIIFKHLNAWAIFLRPSLTVRCTWTIFVSFMFMQIWFLFQKKKKWFSTEYRRERTNKKKNLECKMDDFTIHGCNREQDQYCVHYEHCKTFYFYNTFYEYFCYRSFCIDK